MESMEEEFGGTPGIKVRSTLGGVFKATYDDDDDNESVFEVKKRQRADDDEAKASTKKASTKKAKASEMGVTTGDDYNKFIAQGKFLDTLLMSTKQPAGKPPTGKQVRDNADIFKELGTKLIAALLDYYKVDKSAIVGDTLADVGYKFFEDAFDDKEKIIFRQMPLLRRAVRALISGDPTNIKRFEPYALCVSEPRDAKDVRKALRAITIATDEDDVNTVGKFMDKLRGK